MRILYFFESIRNPFLDFFMSAVTYLGHEALFLIIVLSIFWCVDKRAGYYIMSVSFCGIVTNQFLKMFFRVPRPWVLDPDFKIVENARAAATGYSFPSGHTQTAVGLFGAIARWDHRTSVKLIACIPLILVPISRMYLGVHTPYDVGVSFVLALVFVFVMFPLMQRSEQQLKRGLGVFSFIIVLSLLNLAFVSFYSFPADVDPVHYQDALKTAYLLAGASIGILQVYLVDTRYLHFKTEAVWWAQILKVVGGIVFVFAIRTLLKVPLSFLLAGHPVSDMIRYYLITVSAGTIWPLTFPFFARLGTTKRKG